MTSNPRTASTPGSPTTPADDGTMDAPPCRRLDDFDGAADATEWFVVDDGVMGGRSIGSIDVDDSVMRFTGSVVTEGGGFTSVRLRLGDRAMAGTTRLSMRVRSDARVYGVTLEDDAEANQRSVSHRADFETAGEADDDGWTVTGLNYSELRPSVFGREVNAPAFSPDEAREFGIIIADGVGGDFALEVDWIDVCG